MQKFSQIERLVIFRHIRVSRRSLPGAGSGEPEAAENNKCYVSFVDKIE